MHQQHPQRKRILAAAHLSLFVAYPSVELFPFQAQEVVSGQQDATLGGDGSGRVDVVPSHHSHRDASTLAFPDGFWDLVERGNTIREEMRVVSEQITGDLEVRNQFSSNGTF